MLTAALIYGILATVVALTLVRWWLQAKHDCEDARKQRDRHREDFKEANDRKWELIEQTSSLRAKIEEARIWGQRAVFDRDAARKSLDESNRDRESLRGLLDTVTAERDDAFDQLRKSKRAEEEGARFIASQKGLLETVTAERDEAIREQVKWRETAERARDLVRDIDRMLSELPQPADATNIHF